MALEDDQLAFDRGILKYADNNPNKVLCIYTTLNFQDAMAEIVNQVKKVQSDYQLSETDWKVKYSIDTDA